MALHLSESAERAKARARDLSSKWKHHYLSCEHLFLACCIEDAGCEGWLAEQGFSIDEFEEQVLDLVPLGDDKPIWDGIPESPRWRRVISKDAQVEAESQRAMRVEPMHLLRAIVKDSKSIPSRIVRDGARDVAGSLPTGASSSAKSEPGARGGQDKDSKKNKTPNLDKYSRDIVQMVAEGKVDPIIGRNDEVRRVLQILARKTKSNPVLIGEAGVGKTAVAFALARRIHDGRVPEALKNKKVLELSLSSMVAGAKHRGEFEERLEGVTKEAIADPDMILFIDEIHQLVGAGDSRGGMDASNILKPALARGELRVLGATTTDEFRKYIEKDPALERRFQPVLVGEPSEEEALLMLKGIQKRFESHHGVKFDDKALASAVKLSVRYLPDRNLPDKAIDLIDEAAARVKTHSGVFELDSEGRASIRVSEHIVAEVVADWTGIPAQRMTEQETTRLLRMESELGGKIVGQDHAVAAVAQAIRVVRVGLVAPNRPGGVFMFMGPSGVGKTELGKALAEFLFGDKHEMVRLDMSEYHDKSSVNRLIGSPPGYVGHDEEGQLTKAVRTKPYCVVLLDEVEKAHPEIFDLFLQVFDDGRLTDSKGRTVNFTNTIIVLTSNLGARELFESGVPNEGYAGQLDDLPQEYQKALRGHFRPEFLNRVDEIIAFRSLEKSDLYGIAQIHLQEMKDNLKDSRGVTLQINNDAVELILEHGYQPQFGARPLKRAIDIHLARPLAEEMLRTSPVEGDVFVARREDDRIVFTPAGGQSAEPVERVKHAPTSTEQPISRIPEQPSSEEPSDLVGTSVSHGGPSIRVEMERGEPTEPLQDDLSSFEPESEAQPEPEVPQQEPPPAAPQPPPDLFLKRRPQIISSQPRWSEPSPDEGPSLWVEEEVVDPFKVDPDPEPEPEPEPEPQSQQSGEEPDPRKQPDPSRYRRPPMGPQTPFTPLRSPKKGDL
jgi:ATP-dependent Clp protease ATP-binding subunit ClpC